MPSAPEQIGVTNPNRRTPLRGGPLAAALAGSLLLASPAHAVGTLELFPDPTLLLLLLLAVLALVFPMNALIFRPLFRVLDEREDRIDGARRRADQLERDAAEVLARYRGSLREAREEAERERRAQLDEARGEQATIAARARQQAEEQSARARSEIADSLDEARASLRGSAGQLAREAAERILGRAIT